MAATLTSAAESEPPPVSTDFAQARRHLQGEGVPRDAEKGFELAQKAAAAGHAEAVALLGYCYSVGAGVEKDDAHARRLFAEAAIKGSLAAQGNLGLFLVRGRGGAQEAERGVQLLREAAAAGHQPSAVLLGEIFYFGEHASGAPDFVQAHEILLGPAQAGHADAQNMIGLILRDGRLGEKDELGARVWLEKSAIQGNGKACFNLGEMLWNDRRNDRWTRVEALRWLLLGDMQQEVAAAYFLKDIRTSVDPQEWEAAGDLARLTACGWK